jgi:hypothetical protein
MLNTSVVQPAWVSLFRKPELFLYKTQLLTRT